MDIYFLDLNIFPSEILNNYIKTRSEDNTFLDDLKKKQHFAGKYLLEYVLKNEYGIEKFETKSVDGKPFLKGLPYYFSISHSKNIVGLAIGEKNLGFDIEYNNPERDFGKISKRYGLNIQNKKEFYDFWTKHEAKIKLGSEKKDLFFISGIINDDFTYTIACEENFSIYNFKTINL